MNQHTNRRNVLARLGAAALAAAGLAATQTEDAAGADLRPGYAPSPGWTWNIDGDGYTVRPVREVCLEQASTIAEVERVMGFTFRNRLDDTIYAYQDTVRDEAAARLFVALDGLMSS